MVAERGVDGPAAAAAAATDGDVSTVVILELSVHSFVACPSLR